MKIGFITMHRVDNYGAVLQTYALSKALTDKGFEAYVIDYVPERCKLTYQLKTVRSDRNKSLFHKIFYIIISAPIRLFIFYRFNSFIKKYVKLTKKKYKTSQELKQIGKQFDVYMTGSDQVWNSGFSGKIDPVFLLNFVDKDTKKVSYAASFGKSSLTKEEKPIMYKYLSQYSYITVRENEGVEILKDLGLKGKQVLDPTLLLNKEQWSEIAGKPILKDRYVLIYQLNPNKKIIECAKKLAEKYGLNIVKFGRDIKKQNGVNINFTFSKPENFVNLILNAEFVVTDSFHGTAFSLNLNTQVYVVYPPKFSGRLQSILELTNLTNRIYKDEIDLEQIDFVKVNKIFDECREESLKVLVDMCENS